MFGSICKRWISKNYEYYSVINKGLPVFVDQFETTNKDIIKLKENDDRVDKLTLETQDGKIVKFHRKFKDETSKHFGKYIGSDDFSAFGLTKGTIFEVIGGGFLETGIRIYETILVTDEYIYKRDLRSNSIYLSSYKEIENMLKFEALIIR